MTDLSTSDAVAPTLLPGQSSQPSSLQGVIDRLDSSLAPANFLPSSAQQFLATGTQSAPKVAKSLPDNITALNNKYTELRDQINGLPEVARNALIQMDSDRVAKGQKPLTKDETLKLAQTWVEQKPATEQASRKPLDIPGNLLSNLGTTIKAIPQIPAGILNEIRSLGDFSEYMQTAEGNQIEKIANAPGVRLLPGAYIAGNLAAGTEGIKELATNPLFTVLDALPAASGIAKTTKIGKLATEAALLEGRAPRPLVAALTQKLDDADNIVDRSGRAALKSIRDNTMLGQAFDSFGGARNREMMRMMADEDAGLLNVTAGLEGGDDVVAQVAARGAKMVEDVSVKHGWDDAMRAEFYTKIQRGLEADMSPLELSLSEDLRTMTAELAQETAKTGDTYLIGGEVYPREQGIMLQSLQDDWTFQKRMSDLRGESMNPSGALTADALIDSATDALNRTDPKQTSRQLREMANTLDAYGLDVKDIRSQIVKAENGSQSWEDTTRAMRAQIDNEWDQVQPRRSAFDVSRDIEAQLGKKDIQADRLRKAIARGDGSGITDAVNNIIARKKKLGQLSPDLVSDILSLRDRYQRAPKGTFNSSKVAAAQQRYNTALAKTPPARFGPLIAEKTLEGVEGRVRVPGKAGHYDDIEIEGARDQFLRLEADARGVKELGKEEAVRLATAIEEADWGSFTFMDAETVGQMYRGIGDEVAKTWQMLREAGHEPVFVHRTSKAQLRQTLNPTVRPQPVELTQVRERATDFTPGIKDPFISITAQANEILRQRATESFLERLEASYGVGERELRQQFGVAARDAAQKDPLWGFEPQLRESIGKSMVRFNPNDYGFSWSSVKMDRYRQDGMFIPKAMANNLKAMTNTPSDFAKLADKVTKIFRISVTGLSPRTQLYNALGGATMMMGETGPGAFQYMGRARELMKNPELITDVSLKRALVSSDAIFRDFNDLTKQSDRVAKARGMAAVAGGKTAGRLWDQVQDWKVTKLGGKALDLSLTANSYMDNMYRTMSYLYGYDKALTKGMSPAVAEKAGLAMLRRTMMDWGSLTPIESTLMRSVLPFYSFMNHAVRYVLRYPVDHPMRAAVLASFARIQGQEDLLPDRFLGYLFVGSASKIDGRQNALNLTAVNPFGDVANMLTFTGMLSATNPLIQTALESVGLQQGEAELYPSLRFNAETGRLDGTRGNPLINFAENTIPQSQILMSLFGASTDFNQRLQTDPQGAIRTLASAGGLPVVWRNFSVPQEAFKAELAREDSQQNTLNDALKSGDWQNANRYPGLQGTQARVSALPRAVLDSFTPPESQAIRTQLETLLAGGAGLQPGATGASDLLDAAIAGTDALSTAQSNPIAQSARIGGF